MLSSGEISLQKRLTSTLECEIFAAEKFCFFSKKIDFIIFLREISAANFIVKSGEQTLQLKCHQ